MNISFAEAKEGDLSKWDDFVRKSYNGTIFHTLKFLSYHSDRFEKKQHFFCVKKGGETIGVISFLLIEKDMGFLLKSPYGASYGSFVFIKPLSYEVSNHIVSAFIDLTRRFNVNEMILTPSLPSYGQERSDTFLFSLLERGFTASNRDVCSVFEIDSGRLIRDQITGNARKMIRQASENQIVIERDACVDDFWPVLVATFDKHGVPPTHNFNELSCLKELFPDEIFFHVAKIQGMPVAGICEFFLNKRAICSFYLCQNGEGEKAKALTYLIHDSLEWARTQGFSIYDFGTSSVGMVARPGVFRFKENFCTYGVLRETLEWREDYKSKNLQL